jgi:hypothetical protein
VTQWQCTHSRSFSSQRFCMSKPHFGYELKRYIKDWWLRSSWAEICDERDSIERSCTCPEKYHPAFERSPWSVVRQVIGCPLSSTSTLRPLVSIARLCSRFILFTTFRTSRESIIMLSISLTHRTRSPDNISRQYWNPCTLLQVSCYRQ